MKKRLQLQDLNPDTYKYLSAKLSSFFQQQFGDNLKIRILVAFSIQDNSRGNAILWLTKFFGVFPIEISNPKGEIDHQEFSELPPFSGLTLIIQSLPIMTVENHIKEQNNIVYPNDDNYKLFIEAHNLIAHVPKLDGIKPNFSNVSFERMTQQHVISVSFLQNKKQNILKQLFILQVSVMLKTQRVLKIYYSQNSSPGIYL